MKLPEKLTVEEIARVIGVPVEQWHGSCYGIACLIVGKKLVTGRAVYGHYTGPVAKTGYWAKKRGNPFQRHGWIVLEDDRIFDPTRWSFEDKPPYIYIAEPVDPTDSAAECEICGHVRDEHASSGFFRRCGACEDCDDFDAKQSEYDEGANDFREALERPAPAYDPKAEKIKLDLEPFARNFFLSMLGDPPKITVDQAFWLANLSLRRLGPYAEALYKALAKAGRVALIPIDNRRAVLKGDK